MVSIEIFTIFVTVYKFYFSFIKKNPFLLKRIIRPHEQYFHDIKLKLQLFLFGSVMNDQDRVLII